MKNLAKCWKLNILTIIMSVTCIRGSNLTVEGRIGDSNNTDSIKISLLPESDSPLIISDEDKPILRFGFHRTYDCQNFDKAFICVRKCLDLNYQIAHADKECVCTCHKNSILAKYKGPIDMDSEKWKLGAPTTVRPVWAGGIVEKKPNDYEINANYTEFIGYPKVEPIDEHEEEEEPAAEESSETTPADDDATPDGEDYVAAEGAEGSGAETTTPEPEE